MAALKRFGFKFKDLSPAAIREIIAVFVILCLAIALSLPEFIRDREKAEFQKESLQSDKNFDILPKDESGGK